MNPRRWCPPPAARFVHLFLGIMLLSIPARPAAAQGPVPDPAHSTIPSQVVVSTTGNCNFDVVVRDSSNAPIPGAAVSVDLGECSVSWCANQPRSGNVVLATTNAQGVANFSLCVDGPAPACTAILRANTVELGMAPVAPCTPLPDNRGLHAEDVFATPAPGGTLYIVNAGISYHHVGDSAGNLSCALDLYRNGVLVETQQVPLLVAGGGVYDGCPASPCTGCGDRTDWGTTTCKTTTRPQGPSYCGCEKASLVAFSPAPFSNGDVITVRLRPCADPDCIAEVATSDDSVSVVFAGAPVRAPQPAQSTCPCIVSLSPAGTACFNVVVRDVAGPIQGSSVAVDFGACPVSFCPTQAHTFNTVRATTDAEGVAHFCICGTVDPDCTATISADGIVLCTAPARNLLPRSAPTVFQDDLDGPAGSLLAGATPDQGGGPWTEGGTAFGQFRFAASGGVEDAGPNVASTNATVTSSLTAPLDLQSLAAGEVLHLQVTMANLAATPASNPLESSRVDLLTNTSGGLVALGELATAGMWGANTASGNPIVSAITTRQSGPFLLDLYLDPEDAFGDGNYLNAVLTVNAGCRIAGHLEGLSCGTTVSAIRIVRNIDDEVAFDNLLLEVVPAPQWSSPLFADDLVGPDGSSIAGTTPELGGSPWVAGGQQVNQFYFVAPVGVQDPGPNPRLSNAFVSSSLTSPFTCSSLGAGEVVHLQVQMANVSATPGTNPLESSRVDLMTNTSGGFISLGELSTGGNWGANSPSGAPIASSVSTAQAGTVRLDLYLDPNDAAGDGPTANALFTVDGGPPITGTLAGLSSATTISEVRLVRNLDDEPFFYGLRLGKECLGPLGVTITGVEPAPEGGRAFAIPNPFRSTTAVHFVLAAPADVEASVYDIAGRRLRTLFAGQLDAGPHVTTWDGLDANSRAAAAGVYFVRVSSREKVFSTRVVLVR